MTNFKYLQSMSVDQLAEWLDKHMQYDSSPWCEWWDKQCCNQCEPVVGYVPDFDRECKFAWCELYGKCRFYQDRDDIPNNKDIIKMWLESEAQYVELRRYEI